jgi:hypothetical protein
MLLNLKEDDSLRVKKVVIRDENGCQLHGYSIKLDLFYPDGSNRYFPFDGIEIPVLNKGDIYSIKLISDIINDKGLSTYKYSINGNYIKNDSKWGRVLLSSPGNWEIVGRVHRARSYQYFSENTYRVNIKTYGEDGSKTWGDFKVKEKETHIMIEHTKKIEKYTLWLMGLTIVMAILTILNVIAQREKIIQFYNEIKIKIRRLRHFI